VVEVRVGDEENPDLLRLEPELADRGLDERRRFRRGAVEKDVPAAS